MKNWEWREEFNNHILRSGAKRCQNRAIIYSGNYGYYLTVWHEDKENCIDHTPTYATLDEAKAVAWALATMHNKD